MLPKMIAAGGGVILNMASVLGAQKAAPNRLAYAASKAAVAGFTRALAIDHVKQGIRVNCVCPGTVDTPSLGDRINAFADPAQARKDFVARQPMGRLATAEEIAETFVYLVSDESSFMTGQAVRRRRHEFDCRSKHAMYSRRFGWRPLAKCKTLRLMAPESNHPANPHGDKMKLLRYGPSGREKPGLLDEDGNIRDLSNDRRRSTTRCSRRATSRGSRGQARDAADRARQPAPGRALRRHQQVRRRSGLNYRTTRPSRTCRSRRSRSSS